MTKRIGIGRYMPGVRWRFALHADRGGLQFEAFDRYVYLVWERSA